MARKHSPRAAQQKNDISRLRHIVTTARDLLHHLVFGKHDLITLELRQPLQDGWPDVQATTDATLRRLENCTPRLWSELERSGLIGNQLSMKKSLLDLDLKSGFLARVLKRLNSLLGSLAKAIFVVDVIKEYKDHVEISINDLDQQRLDFTSIVQSDERGAQ